MLSINGTPCHETGCPNARKAWSDGEWVAQYECRECGAMHPDREDAGACCSDEFEEVE
jgi:hypothetical protein